MFQPEFKTDKWVPLHYWPEIYKLIDQNLNGLCLNEAIVRKYRNITIRIEIKEGSPMDKYKTIVHVDLQETELKTDDGETTKANELVNIELPLAISPKTATQQKTQARTMQPKPTISVKKVAPKRALKEGPNEFAIKAMKQKNSVMSELFQ